MHSRQSPRRLRDPLAGAPSIAVHSVISKCQRRPRPRGRRLGIHRCTPRTSFPLASITERTDGEMKKFAKRSLARPARWRCPVGIEASRVATESARARIEGSIARCRGTVSSSSSSRERLATGRIGLIAPAVHHFSIGTRARETRANPRPRSRAIKATEIAVARKGGGRGDRRENKERERIECAPAKAVAVGGEERGREGS